jgi:hypothetical protein
MAMIGYLYIVFIYQKQTVISLKPMFHRWNNLVFICWGILPMAGIFGYWDGFLSSSIYSGKSPAMVICISDTSKCRELAPYYNKVPVKYCGNGSTGIILQTWGLVETNMIANPELRVYKLMQKKLEKKYAGAGLRCRIFLRGK